MPYGTALMPPVTRRSGGNASAHVLVEPYRGPSSKAAVPTGPIAPAPVTAHYPAASPAPTAQVPAQIPAQRFHPVAVDAVRSAPAPLPVSGTPMPGLPKQPPSIIDLRSKTITTVVAADPTTIPAPAPIPLAVPYTQQATAPAAPTHQHDERRSSTWALSCGCAYELPPGYPARPYHDVIRHSNCPKGMGWPTPPDHKGAMLVRQIRI